jgi:hypothetical protein
MTIEISERGLFSLHAYLEELIRMKANKIDCCDPAVPLPVLGNQIAELRVLQAKIQDTLQQNLVCM